MKKCDRCRCTGRVKRVREDEEGRWAVHVCANPRCQNYRREFAEELLVEQPKEKDTPAPDREAEG